MPRRFVEVEDEYGYGGYPVYRPPRYHPGPLRQAGSAVLSIVGLVSGFMAVFFAFVVLMPDHELSQKVLQNLPEQVSQSMPVFPAEWNWFDSLTTTPAPTEPPTTEAPTTEAPKKKSFRPQLGLASSLAITFAIITAITAIDSILTEKYPDEGTSRYLHGTMGSLEEHGTKTVVLSIILYVLVLLGVSLINGRGYLFGFILLGFVASAVWLFDRMMSKNESGDNEQVARARRIFYTMGRAILVLLVLNAVVSFLFSAVNFVLNVIVTIILATLAFFLFDHLAMKSEYRMRAHAELKRVYAEAFDSSDSGK